MENFKISKTFDERIQEAIKQQKEQEMNKIIEGERKIGMTTDSTFLCKTIEKHYEEKYYDLLKEFNKYKEDTRIYLNEADKIRLNYKDLQIAYFELYNKK